MKRILLSLVLISATFGCNAMSPDNRRYVTLFKACKSNSTIALKQVNEALTDNTYIAQNPWVLGYMANKLQETKPFLRYPERHLDDLIYKSIHSSTKTLDSNYYIQIADSYLAQLRIIEFAHQYLKGHPEHSNYNLKPLEEIQPLKTRLNDYLSKTETDPDDISSSTSSIFPENLFLTAAVLIARRRISRR